MKYQGNCNTEKKLHMKSSSFTEKIPKRWNHIKHEVHNPEEKCEIYAVWKISGIMQRWVIRQFQFVLQLLAL